MSSLADELNAEVRRVQEAVRGMIPASAVRAGYNIANLSVMIDETGPNWTADIIGPTEVGAGPMSSPSGVRASTGTMGSIWSPTADGFLDLVGHVAEALHWADIRERAG